VNEDWGPGQLIATWNKNCILCHSTGGYPGWKPGHDALELTQVSELGIACEMCHGRGEEHVRKMESLASRPSATDSQASPDELLIENPKRMSAQASVDVCGRCHSHSQHPPETFSIGHPFQPGMELASKVRFLTEPQDEEGARRYWSDGTSCSGGREYNGVIASKCFTQGDMTCLSCHSMHKSDPAGQLAAGSNSNDACYQCHESYRDKLAEHTHHPVSSSGSLCYNCHMPYTSFALLKAIRSHRIVSPRVKSTTFNSQPNACNLCHLDKTLAWTGERLTEWYDQPEPELNDDDRNISAGVVWMLRGDPLQRSIAAWHLKYPPAKEAAGSDWMAPFAAELLDDDYAGVRWVAGLSIRTLPGFDDFEYQFDGQDDGRAEARESALKIWSASKPSGDSSAVREQLLQVGPRELQSDAVKRLIGERDTRQMRLVE
jgi:predicted CXXCH cytochrome family protein